MTTSTPKNRQILAQIVNGLLGCVVDVNALSVPIARGIDRNGQACSMRNLTAVRSFRSRYWPDAMP